MSDNYGIFEDREENIRTKTPFVSRLPFDMGSTYSWNEFMTMMDSHPNDLYDRNSDKMRIGLNSFHSRGSAPDFARKIYEEMQEVFTLHESKITNIAFSGFGRASGSYPWHKDSMDVFLVQVISTVGLKVEGINDNEPFDFEPGMYAYLPRGTHHQVFPRESRVSFSFGVEGSPDPSIYY
jgi:mannose-6-phosphate isomerase-like protein (cupin superfamily)